MIRGTNRYTVEISSTGSPYFERAICFVRPQFASGSTVSLHKAARQMIRSFDQGEEPDAEVPERGLSAALRAAPLWLLTLIPALLGAVISLAICLLIN